MAFDNSGLHSLLAVGHSTRVTVYLQTIPGHEWKKIDEIQEPCDDASGLVNGLFFFGNKERKLHKERKLFVGYAAEGWTIWQYKSGGGTGDLRRISPAHFSNVCRVGQVRLAPNQERVSIATLDQSAVIYRMSDNGPILESAEPYPLQVPLPENPVLPIAYTSTDLVLGGTSSGDIPVIKSDGAVTPRLRHADGHLLRAVTPHDDLIGEYEYVIAGSTGRDGKTTLKGYVRYIGTRRWFLFSKRARIPTPSEPFSVALSDVLVIGSDEAHKRTWPKSDLDKVASLGRLFRSTKVKVSIGLYIFLMTLILTSDPPGGETYQPNMEDSGETGVMLTTFPRHHYWMLFGMRHFFHFTWFQVSSWSIFGASLLWEFAKYIAKYPLGIIEFLLTGIDMWICERFESYRRLGVCPQFRY
ncbi:unnamed protein product [Rhizoctonia solani]|uniref:Uncharacterized protein n=1 Tax=Rhizoctonia solani TaxID=456999 RepID=A0A8H3BJ74_9AGAM|nr:unnamed protein product [Rhizoctonia solani]